jgi:hypothetical protein
LRQRKAFALLVSLAFVVTAITLVYTMYESTTVIKKSENSLAQKLKLYHYAPQMMNVAAVDFTLVEDEEELKQFFKDYSSFSVPLGDENITVSIKSAQDRIHPNHFITARSKEFFELLEASLEYYGVVNPKFFSNILLDSVDLGSSQTERYSKIALEDIHFRNGNIKSFKQFSAIIEQYRRVTGDENIYSVPWSEVFVFYGEGEAPSLDCSLMGEDTYRALSLYAGLNLYSCDSFDNDEKAKVLAGKFNIKRTVRKQSNYFVKATATLSNKLQQVTIDFTYDLGQKRVVQFD